MHLPTPQSNRTGISRRRFGQLLLGTAAAGLTTRRLWSGQSPAIVTSDALRPKLPSGIASGDVTADSAVIWSRCDRSAQMIVELATTESFKQARTIHGPVAQAESDFTAKLHLSNLPAGERFFYRVRFEDLADRRRISEPLVGTFRAPPTGPRDVMFAWSGDTVGQGWGIDPARGGMRAYEAIRRLQPDFVVHSGDTIYADGPIMPEVKLADGTIWRNLVTEAKSKVAETLAEFRGHHLYNLLDENVRRLYAEAPLFAQWDDHETLNNWYPGKILDDARYREKDVNVLSARARQAFFDCLPIRGQASDKIYRVLPHGPSIELFFLDLRTYRGPNTPNDQPVPGPETAWLGREQLDLLKQRLAASRATWKIMCSDMPLGLIVRDGEKNFEATGAGDGPPRGRELEIAELLAFMKRQRVRNVIWLTADVHYASSNYYDPNKAQFQDFDPFWEFVSGPLHAGTFGRNALDNTFGPVVRFSSLPEGWKPPAAPLPSAGPAAGLQFFGTVRVDGQTRELTVTHYNAAGDKLWAITLPPQMA
jgi:alkaline phosphatase D